MAKLTSLSDLQALLPDDFAAQTDDKPALKQGYDGKAQRLRITTEKRANKTVTLVRGFQSNPDELDVLVGTLKKQCGTGGRVLDNEIELQGDHRAKAAAFLAKQGFAVQ